jgi:hypothetical protein
MIDLHEINNIPIYLVIHDYDNLFMHTRQPFANNILSDAITFNVIIECTYGMIYDLNLNEIG